MPKFRIHYDEENNVPIYDKYFSDSYLPFTNIEELKGTKKLDLEFNEKILEKLNLNYWEDMIRKKTIVSDRSVYIKTGEIEFIKNREQLRKIYIRYKILHSDFKVKVKILDLYKSIASFNDKLFEKYWH